MRSLSSTTALLARYRRHWEQLAAAASGETPEPDLHPSPIREVTGFGSNPGALRLFLHKPEKTAARPPLVVVLHGCTQNATGYDRGAGWSTLADQHGFIALFPEQQRPNNPQACFNWFRPGDISRGRGEALSIRQMVEHVALSHAVDRRRIFVTGLSAGGAMTAVMLATYPEIFAGGAIVAGVPYGCAYKVHDALDCMFQGQTRPASEWGDRVRAASRHRGPWPKVSVWHGGADATVKPVNAAETVKQWTNVHGLGPQPTFEDRVDGFPRQVWCGPDGTAVIESYTITGMDHGTPLATRVGSNPVGVAGPFLLDVGISSTHRIAEFFGLTRRVNGRAAAAVASWAERLLAEPAAHRDPVIPAAASAEAGIVIQDSDLAVLQRKTLPSATPEKVLNGEILPPEPKQESAPSSPRPFDPQKVITDALTAAGLMGKH